MGSFILVMLGLLIGVPLLVLAVVFIIVPLFKGIGWTVRHFARFIGGEIGDVLRIIGAIVTGAVLGIMVIGNIVIGRWSASAHFGRAVQAEMATFGAALYRVLIGHPARFLLLHSLTEGLERRLPAAVAAAPTADKPRAGTGGKGRGRQGQFQGYTIVGSLPGGGSGGKLYIAEPDEIRRASFERAGHGAIRQVVIKTFSLHDGSSLPQIVRESRALDAAKRLGLVLDHELAEDRFFYVMRYVPGDSLALVTQRLHGASDQSAGEGLDRRNLERALGYASDLLRTLDSYHRGGLWHKDVKPDNIIVDHESAHLVDFGLVTPLRSAMTLTTHGTEYFRDPELVRMALKGVKVHQVDGAKFDVYAAGAVLFSMIENSFPAHGGLSQITRRCPEALRWIVRRSMTDYDKRYTSAAAMLADLEVVRTAADPFALRPADLPSMRSAGEAEDVDEAPIRPVVALAGVGAGSDAVGEPVPGIDAGVPRGAAGAAGVAAAAAAVAGTPAYPRQNPHFGRSAGRERPAIRVANWWTGGYVRDDGPDNAGAHGAAFAGQRHQTPWTPRNHGVPAKEQLKSARARAAQARQRAMDRMSQRRTHAGQRDYSVFNGGVAASIMVFMALCLLAGAFMVMVGRSKSTTVRIAGLDAGEAPLLFASGSLPDVLLTAPTAGGNTVSVQIGRPERPAPRVRVEGVPAPAEPPVPPPAISASNRQRAATAPTGPTPGPAGSPQTQRVLVVSEAQPPSAPVLSAISRMSDAGFVLLGNYPGNPADPGELSEQLALVAEAKLVRGLGQLDAPDVSRTLSDWIALQDDVDLIVWFGLPEGVDGKSGPTRYWVFRPLDEDGDAPAERGAFDLAARLLGGR